MDTPRDDREESELTVLLLCNNSVEKCRVLGLLLGLDQLPLQEPEQCVRIRAPRVSTKEKEMLVVVTPDLLLSEASENKAQQMLENCVSTCKPRPQVFLLALQPEDFTDQQKKKAISVLRRFGDESFRRLVIVVLSPLRESSHRWPPPILEMSQKCPNPVLLQRSLTRVVLMEVFHRVLLESSGEGLDLCSDPRNRWKRHVYRSPSGNDPSLRIVLLGENELCDPLWMNHREFHVNARTTLDQSSALQGHWRGTSLTLVRTSNVFEEERKNIRERMKDCVRLCPPGPNVLLLLIKTSTFTDRKRNRLAFTLGLFGQDSFQRAMVVTDDREYWKCPNVNFLLDVYGGCDFHVMEKEDIRTLLERVQGVIRDQDGFLSLSEERNPVLNLLLCGSNGQMKKHALLALSDQTELRVVDFPSLLGEPEKIVMEKALRSVSQYEPQSVHAFILVLPAGSLTNEDKEEICILQKTFGPRIFGLLLIMLYVESEADLLTATEGVQDLCERCGSRSVSFNLEHREEIPELMDMLDEVRCCQPSGYTTRTFAQVQIQRTLKLEEVVKQQQERLQDFVTGEQESPSSDCLRIVLLGKTGNGKSSSGNTILGEREFEAKAATESVTMCCKKVQGEVDGRQVFVVDTPGLFDTRLSPDEVYRELGKCISLLAPGPHVFLLVLAIGRWTAEDKETLTLIRRGFGKNSEKFTIVLFTKGEVLKQGNQSIDDYIQEGNIALRKLISDCEGRYHVFENYSKENSSQVSELMKKMDAMVKVNRGKCFTNEMLQEAEAAILKEKERILKQQTEQMMEQIQEVERKYKAEMEQLEKRINEQEVEMEQERKKQLKEKEDNITQLEKFKQELQRQREKESGAEMKPDSNLKQSMEREPGRVQADMTEPGDGHERRRAESYKENWRKKQEWLEKIRKLDEYQRKNEKLEREAKEEEGRRQQEAENQRKELEDKYKMSVQQIKDSYEENARKQAEEFNGFKEKCNQELKEQQKLLKDKDKHLDFLRALSVRNEEQIRIKHAKEIQNVVRCVTKTRGNLKKVRELVNRQEQEATGANGGEGTETLDSKHAKEITELIQELLNRTDENVCHIL